MTKHYCDKCGNEIAILDDKMEYTTKGICKIHIIIDTDKTKRSELKVVDLNHEFLFCGDCAIKIEKAIFDCIMENNND